MTLYSDAWAEYNNRNNVIFVKYNGVSYNPYYFISSPVFQCQYNSAVLEQKSNDRAGIFFDPSDPTQIITLTNDTLKAMQRAALDGVQKLLDGYKFILDAITDGIIIESNQIIPFWDDFDSTYVSGRVEVPSNEDINNALVALQATVASMPAVQFQSDWSESNSSLPDYIKNKPTIPAAQVQSDWSESNNSLPDYIKNKPTIPASQIQSDWTQASTGSLDFIKNKPLSRSQLSAVRALNSIFQVSATRDCISNYSVDVTTSATLIGGQTGTIYFEICANSSFSSGVQEVARFANGNSVSLAIAITVSQLVTGTLSGYIPAGYYARLRTENTVGTPSFTIRSAQEILL